MTSPYRIDTLLHRNWAEVGQLGLAVEEWPNLLSVVEPRQRSDVKNSCA
jgi:hypothetical protein